MAEVAEFDLIKEYFTPGGARADVMLGVGDDCALLVPPAGRQLAVTVDSLVSGVHFPVETSPADIAYKSIAVSLSDLAAMGAEPAWITLALTLDEIDKDWLQSFSESFLKTLKQYDVQLVGGDTTQGPLSITVQATGFIDSEHVMRRDGARPGDSIYVTGSLGDAALGLKLVSLTESAGRETRDYCLSRLNRPVPRVEFACAAAKYCSCAIDISDGLAADIKHILEASHVGAEIHLDKLPLSSEINEYFTSGGNSVKGIDWALVLGGGDDYELCLFIPQHQQAPVFSIAESMDLPLTCIGKVQPGDELRIIDAHGQNYNLTMTGYEHFK